MTHCLNLTSGPSYSQHSPDQLEDGLIRDLSELVGQHLRRLLSAWEFGNPLKGRMLRECILPFDAKKAMPLKRFCRENEISRERAAKLRSTVLHGLLPGVDRFPIPEDVKSLLIEVFEGGYEEVDLYDLVQLEGKLAALVKAMDNE